ncbi:MAG: hypothetical protein IT410_03425 [Candidatus Doudnabacteria bacterium]|nr:hypothetical protein [Candidatus Doudnabacteria bacterium]
MTSRADGSATWNYKFPGGFKEGVTATVEVAGAAPKSVTVNPPPEASEASGPKKIIPRIEVEETVLSPERTAEGRYAGTICVFNEDTEESMAANLTFRAGKPVAYQSFRNPVKNGVMIWTDKVSAGGHLFFDLVVTERTQIDIFVDGFSSRKFQLNIPFEGVAQTAQRGFGRGWS